MDKTAVLNDFAVFCDNCNAFVDKDPDHRSFTVGSQDYDETLRMFFKHFVLKCGDSTIVGNLLYDWVIAYYRFELGENNVMPRVSCDFVDMHSFGTIDLYTESKEYGYIGYLKVF